MDNSFQKMLIFSAAFILFLGALTACIMLLRSMEQAVQAAHNQAKQFDKNTMVGNEDNSNETYSGTQVLQTVALIRSIGVEIELGGVTFRPDLDLHTTDLSMIQVRSTYRSEYVRGTDGGLQRIRFVRV